jgi:hypothetical protein
MALSEDDWGDYVTKQGWADVPGGARRIRRWPPHAPG